MIQAHTLEKHQSFCLKKTKSKSFLKITPKIARTNYNAFRKHQPHKPTHITPNSTKSGLTLSLTVESFWSIELD